MATGRESDKFMLRLPDGMREQIRRAAEINQRSMNAEIVQRLEDSLSGGLQDSISHLLDIIQADRERTDWILRRIDFLCEVTAREHGIDLREALESGKFHLPDRRRSDP